MQLTQETGRARWGIMFATWCLCALLTGLHARAVRDYVRLLDSLGLRGATEAATPMRHVVPARYADAQMWVRHALAAQAAGDRRVRFTAADNAPHGREVHWASPLTWIIRSAGAVTDVEKALVWLNIPIFLGVLIPLSSWAARRAGAGAGVLVALAMVGHNRFYDAFAPANVDHHGLLAASVSGLVLGLVFMGAGWWKPNLGGAFTTLLPNDALSARRAAILSATSGALGLWISAASVLPAIAIAGAAGLTVVLWRGAAAVRDVARFDPGTWRLWGRVGAVLSVVFYFLEYAASHLGMRLEVNHPLYALAWWGGAEIVATLGLLSVEHARAAARTRAAWRLVLPVLAVLAVPAAIVLGGDRVFALSDPFVAQLRHFVIEGKSLRAAAGAFGFGAVAYPLASCLLLIPAIAMGWRARGEGAMLLGFATLVAAVFIAMGIWEVRWWIVGSGTQIALLLVLVAATRRKWLWVSIVALLVFLPSSVERIAAVRSAVRNGVVDERDILQPLHRDIAAALRATQPEGNIILLASPNASISIGYYGGIKTLGTLFWENASGLKAAAAIFSARTDDEAAALIRARGVTHIAMIPAVSFHAEYFQLLHPLAEVDAIKATFGYRLAGQSPRAPWLQPIPYRKPPDLAIAPTSVSLFRVDFEQTDVARWYHTAVALAAAGDTAAAEASLKAALAQVPAETRFSLAESVGAAFYDYDADAAAVRALRRALELDNVPTVTTTLAWILATTSDASLRNGQAALALVDPIVRRQSNDPTVLSAFAAALAEVGRFAEAASVAARAVDAARAGGDSTPVTLLQKRLDTYRANRPWRQ